MADFKGFGQENSSINIQKLLFKILSRWYLIVISLGFVCGATWVFHRYATLIYRSSMVIRNKELSNSTRSNKGNNQILDGNIYFSSGRSTKEEIEILRSNTIIQEVVQRLNLKVTYTRKGNFKDSDVFPYQPFDIIWDTLSNQVPRGVPFEVEILTNSEFLLSSEHPRWTMLKEPQMFRFGTPISLQDFTFTLSSPSKDAVGNTYEFKINNPSQLVRSFRNRLSIGDRGKSILTLSLAGPTPDRDVLFLDMYVRTIMEQNLNEKNQNATNTINFINEQLDILYDSLRQAESAISDITLNNREVALGSNFLLQQMDDLLDRLTDLEIQQRYTQYLEEYITDLPDQDIVIPSTLGVNSPQLQGLVNTYLQSGLAIRTMDLDENLYNPAIEIAKEENNREMEALRETMLESIRKIKETNTYEIKEQKKEIEQLKRRAQGVLAEEWDFQYRNKIVEFNQGLYNLLLQRRIEASIARASTTGDYQILQGPNSTSRAISPNESQNYLMAIFIGLLLPIGFIVANELLSNKIADVEMLKQVTDIPLLGIVGHNPANSNLVLFDKPKSAIAESFRSIRSNLAFLESDQMPKTFVITSSISNEGKTFSSINLSSVLSFSQKKVVLIGADLRKPKIYEDFGLHNDLGLSNYLASSVTLDDIIQNTHFKYLDVISAGPIPPNPSELLMSDQMKTLVEELKTMYDFIIIDSPPIGIVTDATILMEHAEQTIFIVRQNYTPKGTLKLMDERYQEKKFKNLSMIFNDAKVPKLGAYQYGYGGYGYGYYQEKEGTTRRVRSFIKRTFRI